MMINNDSLEQYKIDTRILTNTFLSTSKQLNVASQFIRNNRDNDDQLMSTILCVYEIRYQRTALDIGHISVVPDEQEVLILPYSTFKIIDIKRNRFDSPRLEIKLQECEPELKPDGFLPSGLVRSDSKLFRSGLFEIRTVPF